VPPGLVGAQYSIAVTCFCILSERTHLYATWARMGRPKTGSSSVEVLEMKIVWSCRQFDELDTQDLYGLLQLRAEIFIVEQDCAYQDVDGFDHEALHVMGLLSASDESSLVSYARLLPPGAKYEGASIGRVVTKKSARGSGIGKALMLNSLAFCKEHWPGEVITISAQLYLQQFYIELGFETESEPYDEDGIPHIRMQLNP
jgi:ElaA protein